MASADNLFFGLIRVLPIDCFVAGHRAAGLFRASNRSRPLRGYLLSWRELECFRLAPGWGRSGEMPDSHIVYQPLRQATIVGHATNAVVRQTSMRTPPEETIRTAMALLMPGTASSSTIDDNVAVANKWPMTRNQPNPAWLGHARPQSRWSRFVDIWNSFLC